MHPNLSKVFLVRFSSANFPQKTVGVCPLYVVGVEPTGSGVAIRLCRGVADQINVTGMSSDEVMDRLAEAWLTMSDSCLAAYMRNDMGLLEDRFLARMHEAVGAQLKKQVQAVRGEVATLVREELQTLAVSDAVEPGAEPVTIAPRKKK